MKARGKEVYIIAGVIAAVVCAAWYFLFFSPVQSKLADLDTQIANQRTTLASAQQTLAQLQAYAKTAPQTEADLVRLNKLLPPESGIPSVMVELIDTTKASGVKFQSIKPEALIQGPTAPFSVQPIDLQFSGTYFDFEDLLYRLESYVEYRNQDFLVSGRLFEVSKLDITSPGAGSSGSGASDNQLQFTVTVNSYVWNNTSAGAGVTGAAGAAGSATASTASTTTAASTVGAQ